MFDQFQPDRAVPSAWLPVEWFAERSRVFVAYIASNLRRDEWLFVIEGRDERGHFREIESRDNIASLEDARALLEKTINQLMATGVKVFPRGAALYSG